MRKLSFLLGMVVVLTLSFVSAESNNFCVLGATGDHITVGEEASDCNETVSHDEDEISGEELKSMTVHEVAKIYDIKDDDLISLISEKVDIDIIASTSIRVLHDDYGFRMSTLKEILGTFEDVDKVSQSLGEYLEMFSFEYLFIILLVIWILFQINKKHKKLNKWIIIITMNIVAPVFAIARPIYVGYIQHAGHEIYTYGRHLGYAGVWLLFIILYAKPLLVLRKMPKTKFGLNIKKYLAFIIQKRRFLGIIIFYLVLAHLLVYMAFWYGKDIALNKFFDVGYLVTGSIAFVALFIGWITSNNRSMKKLKRLRKPIQMSAYVALVVTVFHVFVINKQTGLVLAGLTVFYFILKFFERRRK